MTEIPAFVPAASAKIGPLGAAFYFNETTRARGKELGLGGFGWYVLGRGGVLGDVDASVVSSAFGYFNPDRIRAEWDRARAILDPPTAAREFFECCAALGRAKLSELSGLDRFCRVLEAVNDAANPAGLALYAAIAAQPLAEDLPGRAMQLVAVVREYRGSAHLTAIIASLLEPRIAHFIRRPEMFAGFGYGEDEVPEVTDEDRAKLAAADELTDRIVTQAYGVLDAEGADTLMEGLSAMETAIAS